MQKSVIDDYMMENIVYICYRYFQRIMQQQQQLRYDLRSLQSRIHELKKIYQTSSEQQQNYENHSQQHFDGYSEYHDRTGNTYLHTDRYQSPQKYDTHQAHKTKFGRIIKNQLNPHNSQKLVFQSRRIEADNSWQRFNKIQSNQISQYQAHSLQLQRQVQAFDQQMQQKMLQINQTMETYKILRETRKAYLQQIQQLKSELQQNKKMIPKLKKMQKMESKIIEDIKQQKKEMIKNQQLYNNSYKFVQKIEGKIKQLDKKQIFLQKMVGQAKMQQLQNEEFLGLLQRYQDLHHKKYNMIGQINQTLDHRKNEFMDKELQIQKCKDKNKEIQEVFQGVSAVCEQQRKIIEEIQNKEGISISQLLQRPHKVNDGDSDEEVTGYNNLKKKYGILKSQSPNQTIYGKFHKINSPEKPMYKSKFIDDRRLIEKMVDKFQDNNMRKTATKKMVKPIQNIKRHSLDHHSNDNRIKIKTENINQFPRINHQFSQITHSKGQAEGNIFIRSSPRQQNRWKKMGRSEQFLGSKINKKQKNRSDFDKLYFQQNKKVEKDDKFQDLQKNMRIKMRNGQYFHSSEVGRNQNNRQSHKKIKQRYSSHKNHENSSHKNTKRKPFKSMYYKSQDGIDQFSDKSSLNPLTTQIGQLYLRMLKRRDYQQQKKQRQKKEQNNIVSKSQEVERPLSKKKEKIQQISVQKPEKIQKNIQPDYDQRDYDQTAIKYTQKSIKLSKKEKIKKKGSGPVKLSLPSRQSDCQQSNTQYKKQSKIEKRRTQSPIQELNFQNMGEIRKRLNTIKERDELSRLDNEDQVQS